MPGLVRRTSFQFSYPSPSASVSISIPRRHTCCKISHAFSSPPPSSCCSSSDHGDLAPQTSTSSSNASLSHYHEHLDGNMICDGSIQLISRLGAGRYGQVYLGLQQDSLGQAPHQLHAVKCVQKPFPTYHNGDPLESELVLHQQVSSHENIVSLFSSSEDDDFQYLVLEYNRGGDLWTAIFEQHRFLGQNELTKAIFLDILNGVAFCHAMGVFHCDIKPENVLLSMNKGYLQAKLCDFGMASTKETSTHYRFGTPCYSSPECYRYKGDLSEEPCSLRAHDMWALGLVLFNMVYPIYPWTEPTITNKDFRAYLEEPDVARPDGITNDVWDILKSVLTLDPNERCMIYELRDEVMDLEQVFLLQTSE